MIKYLALLCSIFILNISCAELGKTTVQNNNNNNINIQNNKNNNRIKNLKKKNNNNTVNIAILPGGANNSYTSLYLMKKFEDATKISSGSLFDQFWGISGGSIIASMFGSGSFNEAQDALDAFKKAAPQILNIENLLPKDIFSLIGDPNALTNILEDNNNSRRENFKNILEEQIPNCEFNKDNKNKMVIIASVDKKPIYYADDAINLDGYARIINPISCSDAVINSSNWQIPPNDIKKMIPMAARFINQDLSLFKKAVVEYDNNKYFIVDGFYANGLDANSPLPLAVEYAKKESLNDKKVYNLVVFDNGGPANQAYRDTLNLTNNMTTIKKDDSIINIFILSINDPKFFNNLVISDDASFTYRENLVDNWVNSQAEEFTKAVEILTNKQEN